MIYKRILDPPPESFFLFGPRGSGKSTWIRERIRAAHIFDLLDERLFQSLLADIAGFANVLRALEPGSWVVVDEVQRLPSLLNEVHRFIEGKKLKFVLSGSSARKLKQQGVNLLAGRAMQRRMYPFVPEELGGDFDLDATLQHGTLPIVWSAGDRRETLEAYVQTYLKEEVRAEALVRNLPGFARFLPVAALFHGQRVNVSAIGRDAEVSRTTVHGYLEILEDTLLTIRLPAFQPRLRVREKRHPKLYWIDPGIVRGIRKAWYPPEPHERGALLEGFVLMLLSVHGQRWRLYDEIFYWSPAEAGKTEVDFLLQRAGNYLGIEVKSSSRIRPEDLKGLSAIGDLAGLRRRILVYLGESLQETEEGVQIWPFGHFLKQLENDTLWPH